MAVHEIQLVDRLILQSAAQAVEVRIRLVAQLELQIRAFLEETAFRVVAPTLAAVAVEVQPLVRLARQSEATVEMGEMELPFQSLDRL